MQTVRFTRLTSAYNAAYNGDRPGDQSGEYVRAEVAERLLRFVRRVAYEPVGHSDASHREVLDQLTEEARGILVAESADALIVAQIPEDTNPQPTR